MQFLFPHQSPKPLLFLAPMEGVLDFVLREILTDLGGIDWCVTEFLRVTNHLHSKEKMQNHCPELLHGSRTKSQTPVLFQLLGGDPNPIAENAHFAVEIGACGIDLNFGCPAKTVNRHDGGAALLQFPERLFHIVNTVRKALPPHIPVSAKMRLGFKDHGLLLANAQALETGGAAWLTVHARTKLQGYAPPAHWEEIARVRDHVKTPVVANGDISSIETLKECQKRSQCQHFMVGRSAISQPLLMKSLEKHLNQLEPSLPSETFISTAEKTNLLISFFEKSKNFRNAHYAMDRTKQWLRTLSSSSPEMTSFFNALKVLTHPDQFFKALSTNPRFEIRSS